MNKLYCFLVGSIMLTMIPLYAADDVKTKLTDDAGNSTFAVQNSSAATVFQVDSLGEVDAGTWNATTISIGKGGTGQTTANAAFNALAPDQTGKSSKFLATDAANTSWADPIPNVENAIVLTEEFCGGLLTAGNIGNLAWSPNTIGGAPTYSVQAGEVDRWGVFRIQTTTTSGQGGTIALAGATATTLSARPQVGTTIRFAVRIGSAVLASTIVRIGLATSPTAAQPTDGIYFECDGANWFGVCRAGGIQTVTGNLLAADNTTWHRFRIRYDAANSVYFSADGGAESQITGNIPANTVGVQPSIRVVAGANAAKQINIDYYQIILTGITR